MQSGVEKASPHCITPPEWTVWESHRYLSRQGRVGGILLTPEARPHHLPPAANFPFSFLTSSLPGTHEISTYPGLRRTQQKLTPYSFKSIF